MKKHLTAISIERIRAPKSGQMEIFDLGYPGLALRVGHGGAKSFVLFHRKDGKLKRTTLGRWPKVSLSDARDSWRRVTEGKEPTLEQESTGELFSKVAEEWLRLDIAPRNKESSLKVTARIVDHDLLPALGEKRMDQITRSDIAALIGGVFMRAPAKARGVHAALHRMLKWSLGRGKIVAHPMTGMEPPGKPSSRERVLSDTELARVWKACEGAHGTIVRLLMLTGARREEIAQLKWSEIEGDAIRLTNGRTKTNEARIIPLSQLALDLLASTPRVSEAHVFSTDGRIGGWGHIKDRIDSKSGVTDWVIHDLRRTLSTGMNEKLGIEPHVVEAILGHKLQGVAATYNKAKYESMKRTALIAWGSHVKSLLGT